MSTATGHAAEDAAANYLAKNGYKVIDRNWRTRWCEIDLIVSKNNTVYFVEVKYRASDQWGSGLDYITPKKLQQMQFAAEFWIASHKSQADYCLSAVELTGSPPTVIDYFTI
jgi:uncharacterized protein (TIGR00252 family)